MSAHESGSARRRSARRWILAADALSAVALLLAVWRIVSGGARGGLLRFLVPEMSATGLLLVFVTILLARHVVQKRPTALDRLRGLCRRLAEHEPLGSVWPVFVATRLTVFAAGFFAVVTIGLAPYKGFQLSGDVLTNLPARFDAGWYGGIAMNGYEWPGSFDGRTDVAFFPAMPILMRPVGYALGAGDRERPREIRMARMLWGGVAISLAAFLAGLVYLARLGTHLLDEASAERAVLLLACYPFAFAFSVPYTEALFLLSSVAAVHHFYRAEWGRSGAWGLLSGLTRPNGFLLAVPLGLLAMQRLASHRRSASLATLRDGRLAVASAAMPVVGMLIFTLYLVAKTGVWFAWSRSHAAWGRTFEGAVPVVDVWRRVQEHGVMGLAANDPFSVLNGAALLFAIGMAWPVCRRLGAAWSCYVVLIVVLPALAGGVLSMGRITATIFPIFLALGAMLTTRAAAGWAVGFAVLQGLCAALFFTWRQLY